MAIASLTTWLNNPDRQYESGLLIYEQYGTNAVLLALLRNGSSSYHFNKLQKALEDLNQRDDLEPKPIVIGEYVPEDLTNTRVTKLDYKSSPEVIVDIRDKRNKSFAQARKLHETIKILDLKDHRLQAALELLNHMDHVQESWRTIDAWQATGEIKEVVAQATVPEVSTLTHAQLLREHSNLMSNISKDKALILETTKASLKLKASARLKFREARLIQIRERLKDEAV